MGIIVSNFIFVEIPASSAIALGFFNSLSVDKIWVAVVAAPAFFIENEIEAWIRAKTPNAVLVGSTIAFRYNEDALKFKLVWG
jgi:hypothetical protein